MFQVILVNSQNQIIQASSKKFAEVPSENFAHGAVLINRNRGYMNFGDHTKTKWRVIKPEDSKK